VTDEGGEAYGVKTMTTEFVSEDDLDTFEGWLRHQGFDPATQSPEMLVDWRDMFEEVKQRSAATPKVGLMKLKPGAQLQKVVFTEGVPHL
jgi:hypothetical protein